MNKNNDCYGWGSGVNPHPYYWPKQYNYSVSFHTDCNIISEPKVIHLTAAGLRHSDIEIKEVDGRLTIKTKSGVSGYYTNLNQTYTLKNVKLNSSTLKLGVLTLEFVDTDNIVRHQVKEQ